MLDVISFPSSQEHSAAEKENSVLQVLITIMPVTFLIGCQG